MFTVPDIKQVTASAKVKGKISAVSKGSQLVLFPKFTILVFEHRGPDNEPGFQAACLEYGLFHWANDPRKATMELVLLTSHFIAEFIKQNQSEKITALVQNDFMAPFWSLYRSIELRTNKKRSKDTIPIKQETVDPGIKIDKETISYTPYTQKDMAFA